MNNDSLKGGGSEKAAGKGGGDLDGETAAAPWTVEAPRGRASRACGRAQDWSLYLQRHASGSQIS